MNATNDRSFVGLASLVLFRGGAKKMRLIGLNSFVVLTSVIALGQPASGSFEVASIKPTSSTDRGAAFSVLGNRMTITKANLGFLILYAYDINGVQPLGGPSWVWSEQQQYDVVGKAEGEAKRSPAELKLMLQTLLADRFKLVVHHETRDLSVFALVVAPKGPKLGEAKAADGRPGGQSGPGAGHYTARRMSMATLAGYLRGPLEGKLVLDETGLPGVYAFTLDWNPDGAQGAREDSTRPSLFTALEEQLGLKLEAVKRPIQHLVIDRAEKPSEN